MLISDWKTRKTRTNWKVREIEPWALIPPLCQKTEEKKCLHQGVKVLSGVTKETRVTGASKEGGGGGKGVDVTMAGWTKTRKDRASQPMDAGRLRWAILSGRASWRSCYKICLKCTREHKMIWQQCRLHQFQPCNDCPIIDPPLKEFLHWPHLVDTRHTWCHYHLNQSINWGNDKFSVK